MAKRNNINCDVIYEAQLLSPADFKDKDGKIVENKIVQVNTANGFTDLKSANKFLRLHGMNHDRYMVKRIVGDRVKVIDEGVVGGPLKNDKGVYTNYHYLDSFNKGKNKNKKGGK